MQISILWTELFTPNLLIPPLPLSFSQFYFANTTTVIHFDELGGNYYTSGEVITSNNIFLSDLKNNLKLIHGPLVETFADRAQQSQPWGLNDEESHLFPIFAFSCIINLKETAINEMYRISGRHFVFSFFSPKLSLPAVLQWKYRILYPGNNS